MASINSQQKLSEPQEKSIKCVNNSLPCNADKDQSSSQAQANATDNQTSSSVEPSSTLDNKQPPSKKHQSNNNNIFRPAPLHHHQQHQTSNNKNNIKIKQQKRDQERDNNSFNFNTNRQPDIKIFINNIPPSTNPQKLCDHFANIYGKDNILRCIVPTDRKTDKVLGFGFVTMPENIARDALKSDRVHEIDGKVLRVEESAEGRSDVRGRDGWVVNSNSNIKQQEQCQSSISNTSSNSNTTRPTTIQLYIGNLSPSTLDHELYEHFAQLYGCDNILECHTRKRKKGKCYGYGFVTMTESTAHDALKNDRIHEIDGRVLKVEKSIAVGTVVSGEKRGNRRSGGAERPPTAAKYLDMDGGGGGETPFNGGGGRPFGGEEGGDYPPLWNNGMLPTPRPPYRRARGRGGVDNGPPPSSLPPFQKGRSPPLPHSQHDRCDDRGRENGSIFRRLSESLAQRGDLNREARTNSRRLREGCRSYSRSRSRSR